MIEFYIKFIRHRDSNIKRVPIFLVQGRTKAINQNVLSLTYVEHRLEVSFLDLERLPMTRVQVTISITSQMFQYPKTLRIRSNLFPAPGRYDVVTGNISYESAKRYQNNNERSIPRTKLEKIVTTPCDRRELIEYKEVKEVSGKSKVHHAVFKSRTKRFRGVLKGVNIRTF